jgi:predicted dehydrogenase
VDICVGTDLHYIFVEAALAKNKHVLVEKPLARTYDEAKKIIQLAEQSTCHIMSAMCLRYWPAWVFLKEAIENSTYGKCLSLNFRRQTSFPGGAFYSDDNQCGGALLDLHVHDTDFVNYCMGLPDAVFSQGYKGPSGGVDHVVTNYIFNKTNASPLVSSEGSWTMQEGYGFNMSYTANFENGTLSYLLDGEETLKLSRDAQSENIKLKEGMGYEFEIRAFVDEILSGNKTNLDLLSQAAKTIAIIEAEKISIETCSVVAIKA